MRSGAAQIAIARGHGSLIECDSMVHVSGRLVELYVISIRV